MPPSVNSPRHTTSRSARTRIGRKSASCSGSTGERLARQSPVRENNRAPREVDPWDDPLDDELAITARPRGRKPSKAALAKSKRTKKCKKAEIAPTPAPIPNTEGK